MKTLKELYNGAKETLKKDKVKKGLMVAGGVVAAAVIGGAIYAVTGRGSKDEAITEDEERNFAEHSEPVKVSEVVDFVVDVFLKRSTLSDDIKDDKDYEVEVPVVDEDGDSIWVMSKNVSGKEINCYK